MEFEVTVGRSADGAVVLAPPDANWLFDRDPGFDLAVLDVAGGQLCWSVLSEQPAPTAIVDAPGPAQDWLWAVFGAAAALAVDEFTGAAIQLRCSPALPALLADARRLGYAQWAQRWWPASAIDGIAPLDDRLLAAEIQELTLRCDLLTDLEYEVTQHVPVETRSRAEEYALAAGAGPAGGGLVIAHGTAGWDWRRCPPGLLDASERAVSWEVRRDAGATTTVVRAVAAPGLGGTAPAHLVPHARVHAVDAALTLSRDIWTAELPTAAAPDAVTVYVPGVGSGTTSIDDAENRRRIRDFAAARLRRASDPDLLRAEAAATADDSDF